MLMNLHGRALFPLGSKQNPIRTDGALGQSRYLSRLRNFDGKAISFTRTKQAGDGPYGCILDEYLIDYGSPPGRTIYMDLYHPGYVETRPPRGLYIVHYLSGKHNFTIPQGAGSEGLQRWALRTAKESKPDATTFSRIIGGRLTPKQCLRVVGFGIVLSLSRSDLTEHQFVERILSDKSFELDTPDAATLYHFLFGNEFSNGDHAEDASPELGNRHSSTPTSIAEKKAPEPNENTILLIGLMRKVMSGTGGELGELNRLHEQDILFLAESPDEVGVEDDGTRWHFFYDKHGALTEAWYFCGGQPIDTSLNELKKDILPMIRNKLLRNG